MAIVKIVCDCAILSIFYMDIDGENLRIFFRNTGQNRRCLLRKVSILYI